MNQIKTKQNTKVYNKNEVLNMDQIIVTDLLVRTTIGIFDWEKKIKQDVLINYIIYDPINGAIKNDHIESTKDYKSISKFLIEYVESTNFELLETLAEELAKMMIEKFNLFGLSLTVEKPGALRFAKSVGVKITRFNSIVME